MLEELGITRDRVYIANVVKCRPPEQPRSGARRDRGVPSLARAAARRSSSPKVVVTLGSFADQVAARDEGGHHQAAGRGRTRSATACSSPRLHPAAVLRGGGEPLAQMRADFVRAKQALAGGASSVTYTLRTDSVERHQAVGGRGRRARSSRRPDAAGRRARRRQDRVRAGLRRGARGDRADHEPDVHARSRLRRRAHAAPPPRRVPPRADERGGRPRPAARCSTTAA